MWSQGAGPESDWRCTQTRRFSGEMISSDRATIRFLPRHTLGGCTNLVGGESADASMSGGAMVVALPYRATCEMTPGGAAPLWELVITATITLTPW